MRRLFIALSCLAFGSWAHAVGGNTSLVVSSGSIPTQAVDLYQNATGNVRQAIVIGDRTSSATITVDALTGMTVNLATSTLTTSSAVKVDGTATTQPVSNLVMISTATPSTANPAGSPGANLKVVGDAYGRIINLPGPRLTIASSSGTAITAFGYTTAVAAPGAGFHVRVYYIAASNSASTATTIGWVEGVAGATRYEVYMVQGSAFAHNLNGYWDLASATALSIRSSAAGNVLWTVEYEVLAD